MYKIMTFDGGGIRGALSITLLVRLWTRYPHLLNQVDLLAGTSSGSLIALCLAYGLPPRQVAKLYSQANAQLIFAKSNNRGLIKPKYHNSNLKAMISSVFPTFMRLKDLKHKVVIPAFKLCEGYRGDWRPVFFSNFPDSPTRNDYVVDVAMASTAAPVYFPSYNNYIDGGVVANNPSLVAIANAVDPQGGGQRLENVCLLSFGIGKVNNRIASATDHWGAIQWALYGQTPFPLLNLLLGGVGDTDTTLSYQLLNRNRFFRLNPILPDQVALDNHKLIPQLVYLAKRQDLTPTVRWLRANWV